MNIAAVEQKNIFALVVKTTFSQDSEIETVENISTFMEKNGLNYHESAKMMKEFLDKRFGGYHQVIIGESFGFNIAHDASNLLHAHFGNASILIWKKQS